MYVMVFDFDENLNFTFLHIIIESQNCRRRFKDQNAILQYSIKLKLIKFRQIHLDKFITTKDSIAPQT